MCSPAGNQQLANMTPGGRTAVGVPSSIPNTFTVPGASASARLFFAIVIPEGTSVGLGFVGFKTNWGLGITCRFLHNVCSMYKENAATVVAGVTDPIVGTRSGGGLILKREMIVMYSMIQGWGSLGKLDGSLWEPLSLCVGRQRLQACMLDVCMMFPACWHPAGKPQHPPGAQDFGDARLTCRSMTHVCTLPAGAMCSSQSAMQDSAAQVLIC